MWPFNSKPSPGDDTILATASAPQPTTSSVQSAPTPVDLSTDVVADRPSPRIQRTPDRLGLHPVIRLLAMGVASFTTGFVLGAVDGGSTAAFRYRAENAHRLPTSQAGWYLYGKSKGYHTIVGGVTQGVRNGLGLTAWATLFVAIEEGLDRARGRTFANARERELGMLAHGQRDFLNTASAAVAVAGIHSWVNNLDRFAATRMTRLALRFSIPFGLAQDALASVKGHRPKYVDWVLGKTSDHYNYKKL